MLRGWVGHYVSNVSDLQHNFHCTPMQINVIELNEIKHRIESFWVETNCYLALGGVQNSC